MENKLREEIIIEERNRHIMRSVKNCFYYYEIGKMFKMTEGRISQIVKVEKNKTKKS